MSFVKQVSVCVLLSLKIDIKKLYHLKYQFTIMGVYDFFRGGPCPYCLGQIDVHPEYGKCGDIQCKIWINQPDMNDCFRDFYPGSYTPIPIEYMELQIGPTCCCDRNILVVVINSIIQHYRPICAVPTIVDYQIDSHSLY